MSDSSPSSCPKCQAALPAHATEGLCPHCLMAQVMQPLQVSESEGTPRPTGAAAPELPLPEDLTALLPAETYRVEYLIGRGGMGAVYKGEQLRLDRPVAIKLMRRDQGRDHGFEQRFQREALAMAKLNHPNIVSVIDYGEAGPNYLYIVMELVEGADLMEVLRTGRMTQERALRLLPQICDALQFAHDHGIVHRDIKPSNIMLTRDGRIKMCDFGLAKRHDVESSFHTQSGTGMGTPDYAAPEQFSAADQVDHRADIYALGVMIYQMLTGELPRGAWKPPTQHTPCDPQWDAIVSHAMQTDPRDRYQTASEVKSDVSSIALPSFDQADRPPSEVAEGQSAPPRATSRLPLVLGILGCIVMLAGIPFFTSRPDAGDKAPEAPRSASEADVHTFAGHRYQFVPGAHRWDVAKAMAEAMGGHLATITSKEENEFIYATFGDKLDPDIRASSIWIGGFAEEMGKPFKWVTGEPFGFTDWSAGEPDYSGTSGQPMPGTFGVLIKHHAKLNWFDDPKKRYDLKAGFIVEWDDDGAARPAPSSLGAVDLLALADVVKDAEGGVWRREGADLVVAEDPAKPRIKSSGTRLSLALPVRVTGSYRIEVEFTKRGRKEAIGVLLPLPDGRSVLANFQESGDLAGLVFVRGLNIKDADNPTRTPQQLENGRRYQATVEMLINGEQADITATFEGRPLFRYQGPVKDLDSLRYAQTDQTRPGLKSMDPVTWHSVRITPLDGGTLAPARDGVTLPATKP